MSRSDWFTNEVKKLLSEAKEFAIQGKSKEVETTIDAALAAVNVVNAFNASKMHGLHHGTPMELHIGTVSILI